MPFSLDADIPDTSVSLDTAPPPVSAAVSDSRASKFALGIGPTIGMDQPTIRAQIDSGGEQGMRAQAASTLTVAGNTDRASRMVAGKTLSISDTPPVQEDTVAEKAYSEALIKQQIAEASKRIDDNVLTTAQTEDPDAVSRFMNAASDTLSLREYINTQAQNLQPVVDQDAIFKVPFPDALGGNIPVGSYNSPWHTAVSWLTLGAWGGARQDYLMRGNTPDTPKLFSSKTNFNIIPEANNVREQALEILRLPPDQGKQLFDKAFTALKAEDPSAAQQWAMSIAGMSTNEMITRDAMTAANLVGAAGALGTIKSLARGATDHALGTGTPPPSGGGTPQIPPTLSPSGTLTEGADGVYRTGPHAAENIAEAKKAVEDVLKNSPASPTKANVAEAVGDTKEAAVQKMITSVKQQDPERDAIDTLFDKHRINQEEIRRNPGNNSREEHTRLLDAGDSFEKNTVNAIVETTGLVRLPALAETGFRDVADRVSEYFKGMENTIANIDMYHDSVSNTEHHVLTIGDYTGRPFANKQMAVNAGVNRGMGKLSVYGNDPDTVYIPKAAIFKNATELRDNFVTKQTGTGTWSFHLAHPDGTEVEVLPSVDPHPTHIPFDTKTGKYGQPLPVGPHIQSNALGYWIKWSVPLNEQDDLIRDHYLITDRTRSSSSQKSLVNGSFLGYLRLPQDTLSAAENENRAKLVYTQNRYFKLIQQEMKYVQDLYNGLLPSDARPLGFLGEALNTNKVWTEFKRALVASQKMEDPKTGLPGYYMQTPVEIQHFWYSNYNRPATLSEQQAYLAVGRMDYADWVFRNIGTYKNKSRLGVMEHTLSAPDPATGLRTKSAPFEGRLISKLPEADIPMMIHEKDGSVKWYNGMNTKEKTVYRDTFKRGEYRAIQLYSPDTYPVKVYDKNKNPVRVVYVMSNAMESSPLSYKQVGYRGGGHWDYNYDNYIKQPVMRRFVQGGKVHWVYEGDSTFSPIKNHADGLTFTTKLNQIIRLLRDKKIKEAKAVHMSYSDQPWKDFIKGFFPRKDSQTGEIMPARFNLHEDFRVMPKGYTVAEYDKGFVNKYKALPRSKFINAANGEQSLSRNYQVEYSGARDSHDLFEPYNTGTIQNPLYKFQPAELVDPLVSQTRALRRIIQSAAGDDYKYSAVEHWLQENMDKLDVSSKAEARHSPFSTFMNNNLTRRWNFDLRGQAALSNRYKIQKLIGMPTYMDSQIQLYKQTMADMMFETDSSLKKAMLVPPSWMLGKIHSPTNFFRGMAFHENLGLFNWQQLAAQNTAYINFVALSPGHAIPGTFGAWMHLWSRINKGETTLVKGADGVYRPSTGSIVAAMDKKAQAFGWKPGWFTQAMHVYDSTGFGKIGNSLAIHDPDVKFLLSNADKALQMGTKFFDFAEQNVRHGAWYTAFHEYKAAYPLKRIDDLEAGKILARANDLYMNMGRDSKTAINTGVLSMSLQFYKYIENVGQLFLSKRIGNAFGKDNTRLFRAAQRARMIAAYSLMFGPLGATGLSLLPINDMARKYAIENGYVPGQNTTSTLLMEGPASMAGAYLSGWWRTGNWDMSKGTFYNFNNRYGANGYQLMRDLLEPSTPFWKIVLGASGSTISNNLASLSPFVYAWKSAFNDEQDNPFKLTVDSWKEGLRNAGSFSHAEKLIYAIAFGKWLDRHGRPQQDIGKIDAIFRTLMGTNDVNLDDLYLMRQISEDRKADYHKAGQDFQHYRTLQDQAIKNGDDEQAIQYGKDAMFVLKSRDVPAEEAAKIFAQERSRSTNAQDKMYDEFYKRSVPMSQQPAADAAYQQHFQSKP